ncbi:MAG: metal-sensing transcriptional repressor [Treponema sp.]|nr:metal-sensing transcriptional repressor [Treponema sp.]
MEKDEKSKTKKSRPKAGRNTDDLHLLLNRLNRIEGQIHGIKGMLEKDINSQDILVQISAVNSALNALNKELIAVHIRTSFAKDIRAGNDEAITELSKLVQKLLK